MAGEIRNSKLSAACRSRSSSGKFSGPELHRQRVQRGDRVLSEDFLPGLHDASIVPCELRILTDRPLPPLLTVHGSSRNTTWSSPGA